MTASALENKENIERLKTGDVTVFEAFYRGYYRYLKIIAFRYINDENQAEDLVQDAFMELWKRREQLDIHTSVKAYLRRAVVNKSLNWMRVQYRWINEEEIVEEDVGVSNMHLLEEIEAKDLDHYLGKVIQALPDKRRVIFTMSRYEDLTHKEIAKKLNISIKTVENQMTAALKVIRAAIEIYKKMND